MYTCVHGHQLLHVFSYMYSLQLQEKELQLEEEGLRQKGVGLRQKGVELKHEGEGPQQDGEGLYEEEEENLKPENPPVDVRSVDIPPVATATRYMQLRAFTVQQMWVCTSCPHPVYIMSTSCLHHVYILSTSCLHHVLCMCTYTYMHISYMYM